jgi:uncharacterized protein
MNLPVLQSSQPWYSAGLKFECTQCGNCCTGAPGFVWITTDEIVKLAELLGLTPEQTVDQYCRKTGGQFSLRERRNPQGQYDCVFLETAEGGKRTCGVYQSRPLQCRTWPFWEGNLRTKESWKTAGVRCYGINRGKSYSAAEIEALKDAKEWPKKAPGI